MSKTRMQVPGALAERSRRSFVPDDARLIWSVTYRRGTERRTYRRYADSASVHLVLADERGPFGCTTSDNPRPAELMNDRATVIPDWLIEQARSEGWTARIYVPDGPEIPSARR